MPVNFVHIEPWVKISPERHLAIGNTTATPADRKLFLFQPKGYVPVFRQKGGNAPFVRIINQKRNGLTILFISQDVR